MLCCGTLSAVNLALFYSLAFIGFLGHLIVLFIETLGFSELSGQILLHLHWEMPEVIDTGQRWGSLPLLQSRNNESHIEVHC